MYAFLVIVHITVSLFLIAIVLIQAGRGGLSEAFGGGAAQHLLGTSAAAIITRATAVCAVIFFITSLSLAVLSSHRGQSLLEHAPLQPSAEPAPVSGNTLPQPMAPVPTGEAQGERP